MNGRRIPLKALNAIAFAEACQPSAAKCKNDLPCVGCQGEVLATGVHPQDAV
jgi:hypothetical protein